MIMLAAVGMASSALARSAAQDLLDDAIRSGKWDAGYGHGWQGKRAKLRSRQNHQRNVSPSRRHG